jgi:membrane-associated protease RseP (regulator of RpoE activity)
MKLIDKIGGKYSKTLKFLSYVSITLGYILMILMLIMIFQSVWLYFTTSISEQIKAPPVAPLIPYFPELFGLESYFPSFYFIYFIIALIIVATVHEFAHGIFARKYEVPIKSTGFAFWKYFPAVLGAFVEQDDKFMTKKSSFEQKAILSAGVFANTITAIVFFVILTLFFSLTFAPVGIQYNAYAYNYINISSINQINNVSVENANYSMLIANLQTNEENFNEIKIGNYSFIAKNELIKSQSENSGILFLYYDGVAIRNNLYENIVSINGEKVVSLENLSQTLKQFSPGEKINITTIKDFYNKKIDEKTSEVILTPRPNNKSESWIGIAIVETSPTKVGKILSILPQYSEKNVYYAAPEIAIFIKNLFGGS